MASTTVSSQNPADYDGLSNGLHKLHVSEPNVARHGERTHRVSTPESRTIYRDDENWRSLSPRRSRGSGNYDSFNTEARRATTPSPRKDRYSEGHQSHRDRSHSPRDGYEGTSPRRYNDDDRGRFGNHLAPSGDRRGRSLSRNRGRKEAAFGACRRVIVDGDHPDELRAHVVGGPIDDVNEMAFFGHSGSDGQTLLMVCAKYGRVNSLRMLLDDLRADVNIVGGLGRFNALHYAAWHGHPGAVRLLLEHGADYTAKNVDGETAETAARQHGKSEAADALAAWARDPQCEIAPCAHPPPGNNRHSPSPNSRSSLGHVQAAGC